MSKNIAQKMKKKGITAGEILDIVPEEFLDKLAEETKTDEQVKKMSGKLFFKLLIFLILGSERVSLRVMEIFYNSPQFRAFTGKGKDKTCHSTISDRLKKINPEYFRNIFEYLKRTFGQGKTKIRQRKNIDLIRVDSTLVNISAKLLEHSTYQNKGKKQLKYTIAQKNDFPCFVNIGTSSETSEEVALKKAVLDLQGEMTKNSIIVFDRGLQRRESFQKFTKENIAFVGRLKDRVRYKKLRKHKRIKGIKTETLCLQSDEIVYLRNKQDQWIEEEMRIITAKSLDTDEILRFVTNITDLSASIITDVYRHRWDIEVLFRFMKQELNLKHFSSRHPNGIKVMLYATLITAFLLTIYKQKNQLTGYKIPKIQFVQELEMEVIKEIVLFCGGDTSRLLKLTKPPP